MAHVRLLPGEKEEAVLRPHPLGFLPRYLAAGFPAIWGVFLLWLFGTTWWLGAQAGSWFQVWTFLYGNTAAAYVYAVAGLAVAGAAVAVAGVRWRIFFGYVAAGLAAVALAQWALPGAKETLLPLLLLAAGLLGAAGVEWDRRSHRYVLTDLRIVFQGGAVVRKERQVRYEAITDLDGTQGPLGRIFGYGTIIPVTQSGFGLGEDTSQAGILVGAGASRGGVGGGVGVGAGGGKGLHVGRARSFHQLTGVRPYGDTKHLLERLVQEATATPYLRQQVDLQRRMVDALKRVEGGA